MRNVDAVEGARPITSSMKSISSAERPTSSGAIGGWESSVKSEMRDRGPAGGGRKGGEAREGLK